MALTVAQLVARLTADTSGFYRGMALANSSMIRTGGIISRVAAGAGLAVAGMGILSLRAAGNFQESMNILQAVSGATTEQFKALHDEAIALGRDMKLPNVSAKDAAEAMQELSKAGLSVNDVMSATRGTLQFAIAANIGFSDSANIVARSLTAFGLSGDHAVQVADLFTAAANKSTASAQDIALGFQMASAQFKAGDQTIQGLTTSLTLMANAGIVGSDAGTSLKTMMNRLMAPTKKAKGLMEELGFSVYDLSTGKMKPMPAIIDNLAKSLQGMSKEQQNAALYTLFGSDAIRAARVQLNAGAEGWKKMEEKITKGGEAQKFAEARTKGFNGAMQALFSAVETLAIELGEAMLPAAEKAARALANFVNSIDPQKVIGFFSAIADGVKWIFNLVKGSDLLQYALAGVAGALVGLMVAQKVIGMFKAIQAAWVVLNASFALSPIGLIVLAIAALAAGLVLAYIKVEAFRNAVNDAFSWLKANVLPIVQEIADGIKAHWGEIVEVVKLYVTLIRTYWEQTMGRILNFVIDHWDKISAVISAILSNIVILVKGYLKTLEGVFNLVMGIIHGDWGRAWEGIKQIVSGTLGTMVAYIKNTLTNLIPAVLSLALTIGKSIVTGILNGLANLTGWVLAKIRDAMTSAISSVAGWVAGAAAAIGRAITDGILSGMGNLFSAVKDKIVGGVQGAIDGAMGIFGHSPQKEIGVALGRGIIEGYLMGIRDLPDKVSKTITEALQKGKDTVSGFVDKYKSAFSDLANEALMAFDRQTEAYQTKSEKLLDRLVSKHDTEEFKKRIAEARQAVQEAQTALDQFDPSKYSTPEEASAAQKQLQDDLASAQDAWNQLMYEKKKAALEAQAQKERDNYDERRRIQRGHLEKEFAQLQEWLMKHPTEHKKNQEKILALLRAYGISYHEIGTLLGREFAQGLIDSLAEVRAAASRLASQVAAILRTASPTKEGPMSDLDIWWRSFGKTLASGLDTTPIRNAALDMAGMMRPGAGGGVAFAGSAGTATTGTPIYVQQNVYGSVIHENDLNDRIREAINVETRRGRLDL